MLNQNSIENAESKKNPPEEITTTRRIIQYKKKNKIKPFKQSIQQRAERKLIITILVTLIFTIPLLLLFIEFITKVYKIK